MPPYTWQRHGLHVSHLLWLMWDAIWTGQEQWKIGELLHKRQTVYKCRLPQMLFGPSGGSIWRGLLTKSTQAFRHISTCFPLRMTDSGSAAKVSLKRCAPSETEIRVQMRHCNKSCTLFLLGEQLLHISCASPGTFSTKQHLLPEPSSAVKTRVLSSAAKIMKSRFVSK